MNTFKIFKIMFLAFLLMPLLASMLNSQDRAVGTELWCMEFIDDVNGVTIGGSGTIRQTTDGGLTWLDKSSGTINTLKKTAILTDENILVVGLKGTVVKTTDQGNSWVSKNTGITTDLYGVSFGGRLSETGIAVGDNETIIKTTDMGESWNTVSSSSGFQRSIRYTAVSLANENVGILVGEKGTIMLTSDGGITWYRSPSYVPNVNFKFTIMLTEDIAYATGENGTIVKTTNRGESWITINTGVSNTLYRIRFADDLTAISVGTGGVILKTTDAGESWINETSGTQNNLNCLFVVDDLIAYTGGQEGIILKTTDGGISWVSQGSDYNNNNEILNVNESKLSGYPNPSNPYTNISYSISMRSYVTIKIYNVLGKEVSSLVNEDMNEGTYSLQFNGSNLSSGMYFCKMTIENNSGITAKTMKIILVK